MMELRPSGAFIRYRERCVKTSPLILETLEIEHMEKLSDNQFDDLLNANLAFLDASYFLRRIMM